MADTEKGDIEQEKLKRRKGKEKHCRIQKDRMIERELGTLEETNFKKGEID